MAVQQLSDILSNRLEQNNQVVTNDARVNSGLSSSYFSGTQSYATMNATDRLANSTAGSSNLSGQVNDIVQGRLQQQKIVQQQQQAAAALKAQQDANTQAGKQSFNYQYKGLTASQLNAMRGLGGAQAVYGSGSSTAYRVTGNHANTSGAAGAIGGTQGSGTYKYVYNEQLDAQRNQTLALATSYLGTPYVLGGESHTSMDCSGLVQLVYTQMGFRVPTHSAADQGQTGGRSNGNGIPGVRTALSNLQPGDLVAWKDGSHIAIYAGNGKIIESANPTRGTLERTLWADPSMVVGIHVTFPGEQSAGQAKSSAIRGKQAQLGH